LQIAGWTEMDSQTAFTVLHVRDNRPRFFCEIYLVMFDFRKLISHVLMQ